MRKSLLAVLLSLSFLSAPVAAHEEYENLADAADYTAESILEQLQDRRIRANRVWVVEGTEIASQQRAVYRHQAHAGQVIAEALQSELSRQGLPVQDGSLVNVDPSDIVITSTYSRGALHTYVNIKAVRAGSGVVLASQAFLVRSTLY